MGHADQRRALDELTNSIEQGVRFGRIGARERGDSLHLVPDLAELLHVAELVHVAVVDLDDDDVRRELPLEPGHVGGVVRGELARSRGVHDLDRAVGVFSDGGERLCTGHLQALGVGVPQQKCPDARSDGTEIVV